MLDFYDSTKPVTIQSDSSCCGLGACLLQDSRPIAHASRSMSAAEVNYAQIKKEMLWFLQCKNFTKYVFGKEAIIVESDHKPIESIMKKPLNKAPPHLQRLMLRLQPYDLRFKYVPGKFMCVADKFSRAYLPGTSDSNLYDELSFVIHSFIQQLPVGPVNCANIRQATEKDFALQRVKNYCSTGWPKTKKMFLVAYGVMSPPETLYIQLMGLFLTLIAL